MINQSFIKLIIFKNLTSNFVLLFKLEQVPFLKKLYIYLMKWYHNILT
jgi:hypothetical protein